WNERLRLTSGGNVGIGTTAPAQALEVDGVTSLGPPGGVYGYLNEGGSRELGPYPTLGFNTYGPAFLAGVAGYGGMWQFQDGDGRLIYYTGSQVAAGAAHYQTGRFQITGNGNVGIGRDPNDPHTVARFVVRSAGATGGTNTFQFENANGQTVLGGL